MRAHKINNSSSPVVSDGGLILLEFAGRREICINGARASSADISKVIWKWQLMEGALQYNIGGMAPPSIFSIPSTRYSLLIKNN